MTKKFKNRTKPNQPKQKHKTNKQEKKNHKPNAYTKVKSAGPLSDVTFSKQSIPISQSIPDQFLYGLATKFEYSHDTFCRASKLLKYSFTSSTQG